MVLVHQDRVGSLAVPVTVAQATMALEGLAARQLAGALAVLAAQVQNGPRLLAALMALGVAVVVEQQAEQVVFMALAAAAAEVVLAAVNPVCSF